MYRKLRMLVLGGLLVAAPGAGQDGFNYQGLLRDGGLPVSGAVDLVCTLHDAAAGGDRVGPVQSAQNVDVIDGLFVVELDFGAGAFDGSPRWIEIAVRSPHDASDTQPYETLTPRQPVTPAPFALYALEAASGGSSWSQAGSDLFYSAGRVGIGTDAPHTPLEVAGAVRSDGPGAGFYMFNPGNPGASAHLSWQNDSARLRIGGSGPGANGGFSIQRVGDQVMFRVTDNRHVGIDEADPLARLHVSGNSTGLASSALTSDEIVVEASDAVMGLYSTSGGTWGSAIALKETSGGAVVDNWSIARETAATGSHLAFTYGPNADYGSNAAMMTLSSAGSVGIGSAAPEASLEIEAGGDERALHITHADEVPNLVTIERWVDCYSAADILELKAQAGSNPTAQFIECEMPGDFKFRVWTDGDVTADGTITAGGADFAEMVRVPAGAESVGPGDVMVIDVDQPRALRRATSARSTLVAGIYSTNPGYLGSEHDWDVLAADLLGDLGGDAGGQPESPEAASGVKPIELGRRIDEIPLAVVGIVPCKVSAENGAIRPGDLLVTSDTPGHAMRDDDPRNGTIVGKAFGALDAGTGVISVLVTLQ